MNIYKVNSLFLRSYELKNEILVNTIMQSNPPRLKKSSTCSDVHNLSSHSSPHTSSSISENNLRDVIVSNLNLES